MVLVSIFSMLSMASPQAWWDLSFLRRGPCDRFISKSADALKSAQTSQIVVPESPQEMSLQQLRSQKMHPLTRAILDELIHSETAGNRILRPTIFEFFKKFDEYVIANKIEMTIAADRSVSIKADGQTKRFKSPGSALAYAMSGYAKSEMKDAPAEVGVELDRFEKLAIEERVLGDSLLDWMSFQILTYRMKLLKTEPAVFVKHLQELAAVDFVVEAYMGNPHIRISTEAPVFIDDKLGVSMDILVTSIDRGEEVMLTKGSHLPVDFIEIKQPQRFLKAEDLRPSIVSAIEAVTAPMTRSDKEEIGYEFTGIRLGNMGVPITEAPSAGDIFENAILLLQVDWNFEEVLAWEHRQSQFQRSPTGNVSMNGREIGNIVADVEAMIARVPGNDYLDTIYLTGKDGTPIGTFMRTERTRKDSEFMEQMKMKFPNFHREVQERPWVYLPGVVRLYQDPVSGKNFHSLSHEQLVDFEAAYQ